VVDFTFACIAGVDAKTVIYTVEPHEKKSNCCATDFAKYDLNSTNTRKAQVRTSNVA
jgi:hypothetical protein